MEALIKLEGQSITLSTDALTTAIGNDDDFDAEIEAEILEATTRKITPDLSIEEQIRFEASIGMWDQLASTGNAGRCESCRCRCSVSCFAPPSGVCTVSSTETADGKVACRFGFWTTETLIFALGLCLFVFFASTDTQGNLARFLTKFGVSLMVLCALSPCARDGRTSYYLSSAISILASLTVAPRPQNLSI